VVLVADKRNSDVMEKAEDPGLVDDGTIEIFRSTNDVFNDEDTRFPTNDDIPVTIETNSVLYGIDDVFCSSTRKEMHR
jgi:hypothetical protein